MHEKGDAHGDKVEWWRRNRYQDWRCNLCAYKQQYWILAPCQSPEVHRNHRKKNFITLFCLRLVTHNRHICPRAQARGFLTQLFGNCWCSLQRRSLPSSLGQAPCSDHIIVNSDWNTFEWPNRCNRTHILIKLGLSVTNSKKHIWFMGPTNLWCSSFLFSKCRSRGCLCLIGNLQSGSNTGQHLFGCCRVCSQSPSLYHVRNHLCC